jgi:hypothetical protein
MDFGFLSQQFSHFPFFSQPFFSLQNSSTAVTGWQDFKKMKKRRSGCLVALSLNPRRLYREASWATWKPIPGFC